MLNIRDICLSAPMIPVLTINSVEESVPIAEALVAGGLSVLEVTLRTDSALGAISAIRSKCPDAIVGAGTIRNARQLQQCVDAGAQFGVCPGAPEALIEAVKQSAFPFLPGCATPTEAMELAELGFSLLKFFPAEAAGGVEMLKSLASPLPDIEFCPTGGVNLDNVREYLLLPNVVTVGGSWVTPTLPIKQGEWRKIEQLARSTVEALKD